jgi:protein TonB
MRFAVSGSLFVHGAAAAVAAATMSFAPPEDPHVAEAVSVDLIATHTFTSDAKTTINSEVTVNARAMGAPGQTPAQAEQVETLEPVAAPKLEAKSAQARMPEKLEPLEPVTAMSVLTSASGIEAPAPTLVASIDPAETISAAQPVLEPVTVEEQAVAPMPKPRIAERPAKKVAKIAPVQPKKTKTPVKKQKKAANSSGGGNSGKAKVNSQATKANANARTVRNYPGQVVSKLRRALRYPSGTRATGEAHVQFVVASNGRASSIRLVRSSGDAKIDAAAVATVKRAGPFPAIPAEAGRKSWTFTVPLAFRR